MPDIHLNGLPVLDLLEITPNTEQVAQLTGRNQSGISRIYRKVSARLELKFGKNPDGFQRATNNQTLLNGLRQSSQGLRLRWVGHPGNRLLQGGESPELPPALELLGANDQRAAALLKHRVLNLAVVETEERNHWGETLTALPLVRYPLLLVSDPRVDHSGAEAPRADHPFVMSPRDCMPCNSDAPWSPCPGTAIRQAAM